MFPSKKLDEIVSQVRSKHYPTHGNSLGCICGNEYTYDALMSHIIQQSVRMASEFLEPAIAKVILFKSSGKYYTEEEWRVPERRSVPMI